MPMTLTKSYREAAEGMLRHIENGTLTEGMDGEAAIITVEGDKEWFILNDMDTWGGHLRFVFRDTAAKDEDEQQFRGELAMQVPQLASLLTATATLIVYKRVIYRRETTTWEDGRYVSKTTEEAEEWRDVTEEFVKKVLSTVGWGE